MAFPEYEFPWPDEFMKGPQWRDEPGVTGKTPVRSFLRFGIDIDGTISRAPKHFQRLINALMDAGNTVYIITARDAGRREETEELLASLRIRYHYLIMKPIEWPYTIPDFKVEVILEKDIHMLIDDEEENCWAVELRTPCLAVHMLPAPIVSEEFEGLGHHVWAEETWEQQAKDLTQ
ncbi:MAG TPA: hypothetical protein PLU88_15750 [Armatimonadota bacterium]|nr:hypothetical protein [Armatimonadota bacterium]